MTAWCMIRKLGAAALLAGWLAGCATTGGGRDPLEPLNRAIFGFNEAFDQVLMKPVAEGYHAVLPELVRIGVTNFFSNIEDVWIAANNLLQGKPESALQDVMRVAINTVIGLGGLIDVASDAGLDKHNEDFGQTLGYWGLGDGPYLVLPILGPSSLRDTVGLVGDIYAWPITYVKPPRSRNQLAGGRFLTHRAELLGTSKILETAALDPYEFLRDAYLQRRRNLVHDGSPPPDKDDEPEIKVKPRSERPDESAFPRSTEAENPVNSVWVSGPEEMTPAREAARHVDPQPERASEPRADAAPEPPRVVRVWTSAPSLR